VVGLLRSSSAAPLARIVEAFREGLSDNGFVEGQNVIVEQRWPTISWSVCPTSPLICSAER
jgi:hypothetical protein